MREDAITTTDREQIAAAIEQIAAVPGAGGDDGQDIRQRTSEVVSRELSALLDNGKTCAHRVAARSGGWGLETVAFGGSGWPKEAARLFEGLVQASTEDIALKLGLSPGTVEVYVTEIFRRAKVESRLQLVAKLWE